MSPNQVYCCCQCGKPKTYTTLKHWGITLVRTDGSKLFFCSMKCFHGWTKEHQDVDFRFSEYSNRNGMKLEAREELTF